MKVLKVYKHKRGKTQYKERCWYCKSKLLVHYDDLHFITNGEVLDYYYLCPICHHKQYLSWENDKKMWEYREYISQKLG